MRMRQLGSTGLIVSEIGLGCEHLQGKPERQVLSTVQAALEGGINFLEVFMSEPNVRSAIGKSIRGTDAMVQGHIGSTWRDGQYFRSRDYKACKNAFEDLMTRLNREYIDVGMIHFIDDPEKWDRFAESDTMAYVRKMREKGVIRAVGLSSHNPVAAARAVESGEIEVLLFSLNPVYDMLPPMEIDDLFGEGMRREIKGNRGMNPLREGLYSLCARKGVGITVMKAMAGGMLLNPAASPLGRAMTPVQCAHYALTRPAVASVMLGAATPEEVKGLLRYETATDEEKDFSSILEGQAVSLAGKCVYCNHCLPCPARLDIGAIQKYMDLAAGSDTVPETVMSHYNDLPHHAGECVDCGACEERCPFGVKVRQRMALAKELFGK